MCKSVRIQGLRPGRRRSSRVPDVSAYSPVTGRRVCSGVTPTTERADRAHWFVPIRVAVSMLCAAWRRGLGQRFPTSKSKQHTLGHSRATNRQKGMKGHPVPETNLRSWLVAMSCPGSSTSATPCAPSAQSFSRVFLWRLSGSRGCRRRPGSTSRSSFRFGKPNSQRTSWPPQS